MDQDLALDKYMTVREVAETLKVTDRTVQRHLKAIRDKSDNVVAHGKASFISEAEATEIKLRVERSGRSDKIDTENLPETRLEEDLQIHNAVQILLRRTGILEQENGEQKKLIEHQSAKIAEQRPKAEFYDRVTQSDDTYDIGEVAKMLNIPMVGRNNLFKILRGMGLLMNTNRPYQRYVDRGYFKLVQAETHLGTMPKVVVYQRGIEYIMKRLEAES